MAIELWIDNAGVGRIIVACVHCGEDVSDPGDGLAVWMPGREPDPAEGSVFCVEYAHRECEEQFLEGWPEAEVRATASVNIPLAVLFDSLRQPSAAGQNDPSGAEA